MARENGASLGIVGDVDNLISPTTATVVAIVYFDMAAVGELRTSALLHALLVSQPLEAIVKC